MRKLLFTLFAVCIVACSMAQTQEHLSFKGIPIEGSMAAFCQKLKSKGFTQLGSQGNIRAFKGDFTGRQASVGVIAADNNQDVFSVVVFFDETDSWNTLVNTYSYYKDLYTEKYGNPTDCIEENPSSTSSNTSLMFELFQGRVTWGCIFDAPGGRIQISIEKKDFSYGYVVIKYQDAQNANAKRQSDLDDI